MATHVQRAASAYAAALATDDVDALVASLAGDATFTSPFSHWSDPSDVARVYTTRVKVFHELRIEHVAIADDAFVVAFAARVGDLEVYGAEVVALDERGAPREIRALFQPASALHAIYAGMAAHW